MGFNLNPSLVGRLWRMLAHYHGQIFNVTELATTLGVTQRTINSYIDALEGTFMVRKLQPWFENIKKRQIRSPKVYIRDSGILHGLLKQKTMEDMTGSPKLGASWEGFAMEELLKFLKPDEVFFWATINRAELDLLIIKDGKSMGFEFKYSYSPRVTPSMRIALENLKLDDLTVILPKGESYPLSSNITACGLYEYIQESFPKPSKNS